jgi:hypothetical protein
MNDNERKEIVDLLTSAERLGATGKFPQGKLNEEDEGELKLAVAHKDGEVMLVFGKPVSWLSLPKEEAKAFAQLILKHAEELQTGSCKTQNVTAETLQQRVVAWIRKNLEPGDVFNEETLVTWVGNHCSPADVFEPSELRTWASEDKERSP